MEYKKETAVVKEIDGNSVTVYATYPEKEHGKGKCSGCGLCASKPGGRIYTAVKTAEGHELHKGSVVTVESAEFPYLLSLLIIFILPIVLMVLFPFIGVAAGRSMDIPLFSETWFRPPQAQLSGLQPHPSWALC